MPVYELYDGKKKKKESNEACLSFMRSKRWSFIENVDEIDYVAGVHQGCTNNEIAKWIAFMKEISFMKDILITHNKRVYFPNTYSISECLWVYSAVRYLWEYQERIKYAYQYKEMGFSYDVAFLLAHYYNYNKNTKVFVSRPLHSNHSCLPPGGDVKHLTTVIHKMLEEVGEHDGWTKFPPRISGVYNLIREGGKSCHYPGQIKYDKKGKELINTLFGEEK